MSTKMTYTLIALGAVCCAGVARHFGLPDISAVLLGMGTGLLGKEYLPGSRK